MRFLQKVSVCLALGFFAIPCEAQKTRVGLVEDVPSRGVMNAIKRAYQLTDVCFTPLDSFVSNPSKAYHKGEECRGMVYSSVKETCQFVGLDVSLHTFMTALHNPRSVMYTENVSLAPYHGSNCAAYYGTVCSAFVAYALDMGIYEKTYDYAHSRFFELVNDQSSKGVRLGDVINSGGHVQLVTGIKRDSVTGRAVEMEICEGVRPGCRRDVITGKDLDRLIAKGKRKLYRYKYIEDVRYEPQTDFVALEGEQFMPFQYNDDICTSRGDKACYIVGDSVVLNLFGRCKTVEIFRDSVLYQTIRIGRNKDVTVRDLPYGDYRARAVHGKKMSGFTCWKVVDTHVKLDMDGMKVRFRSANATPVCIEFSTLAGGRPALGYFELTSDDIRRGWADVSSYMSQGEKAKARFVKVHFACDYGRVINRPVKWKKQK